VTPTTLDDYGRALRCRAFRVPWLPDELPHVLPPEWMPYEIGADGVVYWSRLSGAMVIITGEVHDVLVGGAWVAQRWLHLSMSYQSRLPRWPELVAAKEALLGVDRYAVQVCPPRDRYVNIQPNVAHLFAPVDAYPLPEFSGVRPDGTRTL